MTFENSKDDLQDDVLIIGLYTSLKKEGNDEIYQKIEKWEDIELRIRLRRCFLKAGGEVPKGEPIVI